MARKPTSLGMSTGVSSTYDERLAYMRKYTTPSEFMSGGTRSKWERIGYPMFTPAFEMVLFFTPMNPFVYRTLRAIKYGYDVSQGVHDDQLIQYCIQRVCMAKLYWRLKVNGKWTWRPAHITFMDERRIQVDRYPLQLPEGME